MEMIVGERKMKNKKIPKKNWKQEIILCHVLHMNNIQHMYWTSFLWNSIDT